MDMLLLREARREFINALIYHSNGTIEEREAVQLTERYFNSSHIYEGSPLTHKGISVLAKHLLLNLNLI